MSEQCGNAAASGRRPRKARGHLWLTASLSWSLCAKRQKSL